MAIKVIKSQEAVVKTAVVEVKSLTVSGKQVTLAVFRQLEEETLIDPEQLHLRGTPWGRVNYHPDGDCKHLGRHMHVVWQRADELRRATIRASGVEDLEKYRRAKEDLQAAEECLALSLTQDGYREPTYDGQPISKVFLSEIPQRYELWFHADHLAVAPCVRYSVAYAIQSVYIRARRANSLREFSPEIQMHHRKIQDWILRRWNMEGIEGSLRASTDIRTQLHDMRERWQSRYNELEALDQLFIAV